VQIIPIVARNQNLDKSFPRVVLRFGSELCRGSSSALSGLISNAVKLIPGVTYAHWKKVICLDIYSIPHLFWPIAKAGTQINEKKTHTSPLWLQGKKIRLIRQ